MATERLQEELEEELVVPNPSPELRVKALETLSVYIEFGEVYLTANGIDPYGGTTRDKAIRDEYYRRCREGGIIPNSTLTLKTSSMDELFYPSRDPVEIVVDGGGSGIDWYSKINTAIKRATTESLIRGGRFAAIIYKIENNPAFSNFKQLFLHQTLNQGYEISYVDLVLTSSGVSLSVTPQTIKVFTKGREFDKYDTLKVWFEELRGQQRLL